MGWHSFFRPPDRLRLVTAWCTLVLGDAGGARTPACRVGTPADAWLARWRGLRRNIGRFLKQHKSFKMFWHQKLSGTGRFRLPICDKMMFQPRDYVQ